jgi:hypothetical protein
MSDMLNYFWFSDKQHFNLYNYELNKLTQKDWELMSCIVFLNNGTHLWLKSLASIKLHKDVVGPLIDAITFLHEDIYQDYVSGKIETTRHNAFKHGLYLKPSHYLFKQFVVPLLD